ncbi:hypothetical protein MNV49_002063 [Pseudohyphozyma bogoriensis]|nr:hypothetical protein MNV49_002063 [Pseudohyphozyma bogoriensis]
MFEMSMLQHSAFRVLHEPMGDPFYWGKEKVSERYSDEVCEKNFKHFHEFTFEKTWNDMVNPPQVEGEPVMRTFSKDMAKFICPLRSSRKQPPSTSVPSLPLPPTNTDENPTLIPTALLLDPSINHSFMIRHPAKAIPSFDRLCYPGSTTGFDYYDCENDPGYRECRVLFDWLRKMGREPVVIESEELVKAPEKVLKGWCEKAGVEFEEGMLNWEEGARSHFEKWPGFHNAAQFSQGINKGLRDEYKTPENYVEEKNTATKAAAPVEKKELRPEIVKAIEDNLEDYLYLKGFAEKQ